MMMRNISSQGGPGLIYSDFMLNFYIAMAAALDAYAEHLRAYQSPIITRNRGKLLMNRGRVLIVGEAG